MGFRYDIKKLPKQRQIIIEKMNQSSNKGVAAKNKQSNDTKNVSEQTVYKIMNVNQEYLVVDIADKLSIERNDAKYYLEELVKKGLVNSVKYSNDRRKSAYCITKND